MSGTTIPVSYNLTTDLGRDSAEIKTKIYNYKDILRYQNWENPWTIGQDVHFTNEGYSLAGKIIGREITSILRRGE